MTQVVEKDLIKIFKRLKELLRKYDKQLSSKTDSDSNYDLWSFKSIEIGGRKKEEMFFASIIIQSKMLVSITCLSIQILLQ